MSTYFAVRRVDEDLFVSSNGRNGYQVTAEDPGELAERLISAGYGADIEAVGLWKQDDDTPKPCGENEWEKFVEAGQNHAGGSTSRGVGR